MPDKHIHEHTDTHLSRSGAPPQPECELILPISQTTLAIFLINMDSATERLAAMEAKLKHAGLPFQRIKGIDGSQLTFPMAEFSERHYRLLHGRRTSPAEIGCYLSHIACARAFLDSNADLALILEDDVSFDTDFIVSLDSAARHRDLWNILRLTTVNSGRKYPVRKITEERSLAIALTREKGAGAYVIDQKTAKWFVNCLIPMRLAFDIAFDLEYLSGLHACFIEPVPASQSSKHETQIQSNIRSLKLPRWRYFTVLPYRAWLEITRLFLRGQRLIRTKIGLGF